MNLVSVIMPAYNAEKYISDAIQSVINQTYSNWELIIVDDGSTDNTQSIIFNYLKLDSRIKLYFQTHGRQAKARNFAILKSKGEIISFLDADDYWIPNKLEIQLNYFLQSNADLIFSNAFIINEEHCDSISDFGIENALYFGKKSILKILDYNKIPMLTVIVKKTKLIEVGLFCEDYELRNAEDYHLWLKLLVNNSKFISISEKTAFYRIHPFSSTYLLKNLNESSFYAKACVMENNRMLIKEFLIDSYLFFKKFETNKDIDLGKVKHKYFELESEFESFKNSKFYLFFTLYHKLKLQLSKLFVSLILAYL